MTKQEEIRKALQTATPGKWEVNDFDTMYSAEIISEHPKGVFNGIASGMYVPNAHLIANAPEWLSYLLTELEHTQQSHDVANECMEAAYRKVDELTTELDTAQKQTEEWRDLLRDTTSALAGELDSVKKERNESLAKMAISEVDLRRELEAAKKQLSDLCPIADFDVITTLQTEKAHMRDEVAELRMELDKANIKIAQLEGQKAFAFRERDYIRNINQDFAKRHEAMEQEIERLRDKKAEILKVAFKNHHHWSSKLDKAIEALECISTTPIIKLTPNDLIDWAYDIRKMARKAISIIREGESHGNES